MNFGPQLTIGVRVTFQSLHLGILVLQKLRSHVFQNEKSLATKSAFPFHKVKMTWTQGRSESSV